MAIDNDSLPTEFALRLMESCDFLTRIEDCKGNADIITLRKRKNLIADFQRMACVATFDQAMLAFHGTEIDGLQTDTLKVVYESTKPWIMGLALDACINAVTFRSLGKNEFAEAIKTIVEQASVKKADEPGKRMKGILVKVSKRET